MFEFDEFLEEVIVVFMFKFLVGKWVLIIVGLIFEVIDLVCGIINLLFGCMGYVVV